MLGMLFVTRINDYIKIFEPFHITWNSLFAFNTLSYSIVVTFVRIQEISIITIIYHYINVSFWPMLNFFRSQNLITANQLKLHSDLLKFKLNILC